jgi:hypothetical protein
MASYSLAINQEDLTMKMKTIALAAVFALASTLASAHGRHHRYHHYSYYSANSNPNGTASGPTTLSGTGPSTFGGNKPGPGR